MIFLCRIIAAVILEKDFEVTNSTLGNNYSNIGYAESNEKLLHLFIPWKTAILVSEFAVEDLPLGRTAAFVPEFVVNDLP